MNQIKIDKKVENERNVAAKRFFITYKPAKYIYLNVLAIFERSC